MTLRVHTVPEPWYGMIAITLTSLILGIGSIAAGGLVWYDVLVNGNPVENGYVALAAIYLPFMGVIATIVGVWYPYGWYKERCSYNEWMAENRKLRECQISRIITETRRKHHEAIRERYR